MLARLIALQDLLQLRRDFEDSSYEELGFPVAGSEAVSALDTEISSLKKEIEPGVLRRFETIARKYDRPLVPARKGTCFGCFVRFPTATATQKSEELATCENCGRLLYEVP